jgi:hypothetical protein
MLTDLELYIILNVLFTLIIGSFIVAPIDWRETVPPCSTPDNTLEFLTEKDSLDPPLSESEALPEPEDQLSIQSDSHVESDIGDSPSTVEASTSIKPRNTTKYNHHLWPSPRPVIFARTLIKRNPSLKPVSRLTHEVALGILANHAKLTVEALLLTNPLVYSKKYMFNAFSLGNKYMFNAFPLGNYVRRELASKLSSDERVYAEYSR